MKRHRLNSFIYRHMPYGALLTGIIALSLGIAPAANVYWSGSGTSPAWSNVASWAISADGATPATDIPKASDIANFSISSITNTAQTVNLGAAQAATGLVFHGTNTATTTLLGGGTNRALTLGTSGITVNSGAGAVTIGSATSGQAVTITLAGAQTWTNNSGNVLTETNDIANGGYLLTLAGTGDHDINGINSGAGGLTKSGTGTATLTGANTFSGQLTVEQGILKVATVNNASASGVFGSSALAMILGKTGGITGTLEYTGASASSTKKFTMATGGTGAFQVDTSGTVLTLSGVIDGGGSLTKTGDGTLTLSGSTNTYTGGTNVEAGFLSVASLATSIPSTGTVTLGRNGGTGTLIYTGTTSAATDRLFTMAADGTGAFDVFDSGMVLTISNPIDGTGGLTKTGAGTLKLDGTNTYTGLTTVLAGTLSLGNATDTLPDSAAVTVSGATAVLSVANRTDTVGAVTVSSGGSIIGAGGGILTSTGSFEMQSGSVSAILAGAAPLNKTTAGTVTLSGANTYSGNTLISTGTLTLGNNLALQNSVLDTSGAGTLAFSSGFNTPTFGGLTSATNLTLASNVTGLTLKLGTGVTSTFFGVLANAAANMTLSKTGTGVQVFAGANTYSGVTTVSAGVLRLNHASALPGGIASTGGTSALTFNGGVIGLGNGNFTRSLAAAGTVTGVTFTGAGGWAAYGADRTVNLGGTSASITWATASTGFNGQTLILGASTATHTVDLQNPLDLGTATRTVQVDDGAAAIDGRLSGVLSNTGGLTKTGTGTLILTNSNTYTGLTTVSEGTLSLGHASNTIANTAAITVSGGTLDVANPDTVGVVTLSSGTISGTGTLTGASYALTGTGTISATLGGAGIALEKTVAGTTTTLSGTNAYTGATTLTSGTLSVAADANLGNANSLVFNGGTLQITGTSLNSYAASKIGNHTVTLTATKLVGFDIADAGNNFTVSQALTQTTGGLTKTGAGTLELSGTNTFSGQLTVEQGILKVATANNASANGVFGNSATAVILGKTGGITGTLEYTGTNATSSKPFTMATGGTGAFQVDTTGTVLTLSGVIAGTSNLTKTGAGTLEFTNTSNSFTGALAVTDGILKIGTITGTITNASTVTLGKSGGAGTFQYTGTGAAATTRTFIMATGGTGTFQIDDNLPISGLISGSGNLTKTGAGVLRLDAANTYAGLTTVSLGTLTYGIANALGSGGVTVNGGTLALSTYNGTVGEVTLSSGSITGSGTLTSTSGFTMNNDIANSTSVAAPLGGTNIALTKTGAGTVTLSATNTYTGLTTVSEGTLTLGNTSNTIANTAPVTVNGGTLALGSNSDTVGAVTLSSGTISSSAGTLTGTSYALTDTGTISAKLAGAVTLTKTGTGTAVVSGINTYTGITTVSAGVLQLNGASALPGGIGSTLGTSNLTFNGGVIGLGVGNFSRSLNTAATVAAATFAGAGGWAAYTADRTVNLGGASAAITWAAANTGFNGQTVILGASTATHMVDLQNPIDLGSAVRTVQLDDGSAAIDGKLSGVLSGAGGSLSKTGAGTLVLSGTNSYSGKTVVGNGSLSFSLGNTTAASNQSLGTNTDVDLGVASASSGTLVYTGGADTLAKNINALGNGSDTIENAGTGLLTLSGTLAKTGTVLTLKGGGYGITVTGAITGTTGSPNSDLIIDGGITTLAYANTYEGPTYIRNSATLNANVTNALPTENGRTAVTFDGGGTSTLVLGKDQSIASLTGASTAVVTLGANTLTLGATTGSTTFSGAIGGTGGLTKDGASTQVLSGTNTYTGVTTIQAGTLELSAAGSVSHSSKIIVGDSSGSGAVLAVGGLTSGFEVVSSQIFAGHGSVTGAVTVNSGGTQTAGDAVTVANSSGAGTIGKATFSTGITYNAGSIFEWNLSANDATVVGTRGTDYDAVNTASLAGVSTGDKAIFRVVLNGDQDFSESFWNMTRTWADIFKTADSGTALSINSIFGSVESSNASGPVVSTGQGSFSMAGSSLTWSPVPEPSTALAGLLLGMGLLRRRR